MTPIHDTIVNVQVNVQLNVDHDLLHRELIRTIEDQKGRLQDILRNRGVDTFTVGRFLDDIGHLNGHIAYQLIHSLTYEAIGRHLYIDGNLLRYNDHLVRFRDSLTNIRDYNYYNGNLNLFFSVTSLLTRTANIHARYNFKRRRQTSTSHLRILHLNRNLDRLISYNNVHRLIYHDTLRADYLFSNILRFFINFKMFKFHLLACRRYHALFFQVSAVTCRSSANGDGHRYHGHDSGNGGLPLIHE